MIVPVILFVLSLCGTLLSFALPGMSDLLLLAGPAALASLILILQARRRKDRGAGGTTARNRGRFSPFAKPRYILLDGSNVMHWKDETPRIDTVRQVVNHLKSLGYAPVVVFDANAGYKISDRYLHDTAMGRLLGLPTDRVTVVGKGKPADPVLLAYARDLKARIITNDRYRDWAEQHPEVANPGHLIRGGYQDATLWLDLDPPA